MFEQSLMESGGGLRRHRGLVTSISALAQLTLLAIAVLLPMIFSQTLPLLKQRSVERVLIPRSVPPPEPPPPTNEGGRQNNLSSGPRTIVVNNPFPAMRTLASGHEVNQPQIPQWYSPSTGPGDLPIGNTTSNVSGPSKPPIVSILSEGRIIRRVTPEYPAIAKRTGVQGKVVLEAVISRAGRIENLRLISGHPWLASAAEAAVSQWQFRPYILNGAPIEVMTQITVDFKLNRE
jgi:periplasmic protein TonB